jgi:hypothetical protein
MWFVGKGRLFYSPENQGYQFFRFDTTTVLRVAGKSVIMNTNWMPVGDAEVKNGFSLCRTGIIPLSLSRRFAPYAMRRQEV